MPAVVVEDLLTLPRVPRPDPAAAVDRPVRAVTTAPERLRGRGLPGQARLRRRRHGGAGPVHPHGPDGRGRVRPRRAQGHVVAPAPRLRDRHVHDRRGHAAPGLDRRRRRHRQRRDPVDDRRQRHPAHRGAAGGARRLRRAVPRDPAVGEPAGGGQVGRSRATRTSARARSRCCRPTTVARCCGSWPATSRGTAGPASRTRRSRCCTRRSAPAPRWRCPGTRSFNALVYVLSGHGTVGAEQRPVRGGQLAVFGPGDVVRVRCRPGPGQSYAGAGRAGPRRSTDPRAGRAVRTVRHEHQGRAAAGVRGLPGRPHGHHPRSLTLDGPTGR